ncbi:uncharacterized protein LOC111092897 isoform X1 [Canis lupus familiaris]|uniref:uncharacterized protein LOC111092897 isoform X1 n=1 Tax=Canis lupus familiaris TaxID=9615 RepID=UPI0018F7D38A|nr:uncharacterized protein LOC111092897 isoform X1 [Canis lupus familiaris]
MGAEEAASETDSAPQQAGSPRGEGQAAGPILSPLPPRMDLSSGPQVFPSTEASDTPFLSRGIPSFRPSPRTAPTHHPTTGQRDRDPQAEARSHRPLNSPGPWCSKLFPVLIPVALRTRCWHSCPDHRPARRPH